MGPLVRSWEEMSVEAGILDKAHSQTNQDVRDVGTVRKEKWVFHVGIFSPTGKKEVEMPAVLQNCLEFAIVASS